MTYYVLAVADNEPQGSPRLPGHGLRRICAVPISFPLSGTSLLVPASPPCPAIAGIWPWPWGHIIFPGMTRCAMRVLRFPDTEVGRCKTKKRGPKQGILAGSLESRDWMGKAGTRPSRPRFQIGACQVSRETGDPAG